jgi:PAS domain S-box-containing protein
MADTVAIVAAAANLAGAPAGLGDSTDERRPVGRALWPSTLGIGRIFVRPRDAVIVADVAGGTILLWNRGAQRLFGFSAGQAAGLPLDALVPAALRPELRAELARHDRRRAGWSLDACVPFEFTAVDCQGQEIAVELTLTSLDRCPDSPACVLVVARPLAEAAAEGQPDKVEGQSMSWRSGPAAAA